MAWAEPTSEGRYRGLYRDASGARHTVAGGPFTSKAEAKRRAGAAEDEARRRPGRPGPKAGRQTWGAFADDEWWPRRRVEPGTLVREQSRRTKHLDPYWSHVRLDTITREMVQDWIGELEESGLAPGTVRNCFYLLSNSMKAALTAGRVPANPCVAIELPAQPLPDARFLTWEEVQALTHFLDGNDALLVWFLVGTGMRWGEAVGCHRHRLDLEQARVDVHEVWDVKAAQMKGYPKSRRRRSVPLPGWLVGMLREHLDADPGWPSCGKAHRGGARCQSGLVIPGRGGRVIAYPKFHQTRWVDACSRAGLHNVRIHDLRHSYASWLIQSGVTIEALSDLLGHGSIATTMRYSFLADTQWSAVRRALDETAAAGRSATDEPLAVVDDRHLRSS